MPRERQPYEGSPVAASKASRPPRHRFDGQCAPLGFGGRRPDSPATPAQPWSSSSSQPRRIGAMVEAHLGDDGTRAELELAPQRRPQLIVAEPRVALRITGDGYARVGRDRSQVLEQRSGPGVRAGVVRRVTADDEELVDAVICAAGHQPPEVVAAGDRTCGQVRHHAVARVGQFAGELDGAIGPVVAQAGDAERELIRHDRAHALGHTLARNDLHARVTDECRRGDRRHRVPRISSRHEQHAKCCLAAVADRSAVREQPFHGMKPDGPGSCNSSRAASNPSSDLVVSNA